MELLAADDYPLGGVLWTLVLFFGLMLYFWLIILVFRDLFGRDLSGGAKTAWTLFLIVLPIAGALTYLISQGRSMADREADRTAVVRQRAGADIRSAGPAGSRPVDEIARAKQLLDDGVLSQEEFDQLKRRVLV